MDNRKVENYNKFMTACCDEDSNTVKDLIVQTVEIQGSLDFTGCDGDTPLEVSLYRMGNNFHVAKTLIDSGADINHSDKYGLTVLFKITAFSYIEAVNFLLDNGADINHVDHRGGTPLTAALSSIDCTTDLITLLIDRGANIDYIDRQGLSILMFASSGTDPHYIKLLLSLGADPYYKDPKGRSFLDLLDDEYAEEIKDHLKDIEHRKGNIKSSKRVLSLYSFILYS